MHQSTTTTISYTYGDDNCNVVDQNGVISRVPSVLGSIKLQQEAGITEKMSRMMKTAVNDASRNAATNVRQQGKLKRQNARKKSALEDEQEERCWYCFMKIFQVEDGLEVNNIYVEDCQDREMSVEEALMTSMQQ